MKQCKVCKETKELEAFYPNKQCKLGVTGTCRSCSRTRINGWYQTNRARRQQVANTANQLKKLQAIDYLGGKCHDCENTFQPCVYDFHHLDPSKKDVNPSKALTRKNWKSELDKCILLCANCHRIRHFVNDERKDG